MADPVISAAAAASVPETWHVNPYHSKFNPSTKAGQAIFKRKLRACLRMSVSLQQRNIPRVFVAYCKQNIHRWLHWLLESRKNMMPWVM